MRPWLCGVALATPFALGTAVADQPGGGEVAFVMADPEIVESSGLAVIDRPEPGPGPLVATVNDSGDVGRVFAVDPTTGETVGVTSWAEQPRDVEALAPAGPGQVWVGDIGDNLQARDGVQVRKVPLGRADLSSGAPAFALTYPDGPHDAEALLSHPRTGRLLVVSKGVFGGGAYAAPVELDPDRNNALTFLGAVVGIVTDGAFWPDGRHLVLRTYQSAHFYSYPELEHVGELDLPEQPQGEGIAVTSDGELLVSTEGIGSEVLRVPLPAELQRMLDAEPAGTGPAGTGPATPENWWRWIVGLLLPSI